MTDNPFEALAAEIAERLFTNGDQIADQLALMQGTYPKGQYLGGWSESVVRDQVKQILADHLTQVGFRFETKHGLGWSSDEREGEGWVPVYKLDLNKAEQR